MRNRTYATRYVARALIAFIAHAEAAGAANLTYSAILEQLQTRTDATGSQGGGVFDADADHGAVPIFSSSVTSASLDLDTQTGAFAVADASANEDIALNPGDFEARSAVSFGLTTVAPGQAHADAQSILEFTFVSDADVDILFSGQVACTGSGCDTSVQLLGPLGTGALLDLSTQNGIVQGSVTAHILAGQPYTVIAGALAKGTLNAVTGLDGGSGGFELGLSFGAGTGGVPEPRAIALLGAGLVALAGRRRLAHGPQAGR